MPTPTATGATERYIPCSLDPVIALSHQDTEETKAQVIHHNKVVGERCHR